MIQLKKKGRTHPLAVPGTKIQGATLTRIKGRDSEAAKIIRLLHI